MYIKYRACVNTNSIEDENFSDVRGFLLTFQCKKSNEINVCNNLQHVLYNSILDSNGLFDKITKTY